MIKDPPNIKTHLLDFCYSEESFLQIKHLKLKLEYPDGSFSKEFNHDVVGRKAADAVVICAYESSHLKSIGSLRKVGSVYTNSEYIPSKVWLRSCVRPAIATAKPFPNTFGNEWELPAGLIEIYEDPVDAVVREIKEELGFTINKKDVQLMGRPLYAAVGMSRESLYFYSVNVKDLERCLPSEDGSALERFGECELMLIEDAIQVGDLKTELGIRRLISFLDK
jgi:8-oxo-dGTP pyrophosphatase MutT (NUDIX family)